MTRRALPGGIEIDDDPARLDVHAIVAFLSTESYWARDRTHQVIETGIRNAYRVVGAYEEDRQVGFARAVSDGVVVAYLADVYVLKDYQGRGIGRAIVEEMVERGPIAGLRWMLHTKDAHGLYERFGFHSPGRRSLERERRPSG